MVRHIPNILTIFRILVTPFFVSFFMPGLSWKMIMFFVFLISTITDKVDGHLARKYKWESALGKFLDPLADKVLITAAFICLIFVDYIDIWMVVIIVLRDFFVTWLRTFGHKKGQPVNTFCHLAAHFWAQKGTAGKYARDRALENRRADCRSLYRFCLYDFTKFALCHRVCFSRSG